MMLSLGAIPNGTGFDLPRPTFDLRRRSSTLSTDALQQGASRFVTRVLRHEFAPESLGEDSLVEMINQLVGAGCLGCEAINPGEPNLDATDDLTTLLKLNGQWDG